MHLGNADRQVGREITAQSAQGVVPQSRGDCPESDDSVTVVLKRLQPAFLFLLSGGMSPVYPCHVPAPQMRQRPIGTGPFKFVEFKPNEYIRLAKNPDY